MVAEAQVASTAVVTDIAVGRMTCAARVRRVERRLGTLDGVTAMVKLATGRARVSSLCCQAARQLPEQCQAARSPPVP